MFHFLGYRQIVQSFRYFVKKQMGKMNTMVEKRAQRAKGTILRKNALEKRANEDHIIYGLGQNTIFCRMYESKLDSANIAKLVSNYNSWGQPIVIDLVSYFRSWSIIFTILPKPDGQKE